MVARRTSRKTAKQLPLPAAIGIVLIAAILICGVAYKIFFTKPLTSDEGIQAMQKAVSAGQILNTPPDKLRSLGVKLPDGYDQKATERISRLEAEARAKAAAERAGN